MRRKTWHVSLRIVADMEPDGQLAIVDELRFVSTSLTRMFEDLVKTIVQEEQGRDVLHGPGKKEWQGHPCKQFHYHVTVSEVLNDGKEEEIRTLSGSTRLDTQPSVGEGESRSSSGEGSHPPPGGERADPDAARTPDPE